MPEPFVESCLIGSCSLFLHLYLWLLFLNHFLLLMLNRCAKIIWKSKPGHHKRLHILPAESSVGFMAIHSSLSSKSVMKILHSSYTWLDPLSSALPIRQQTLDNYALRSMSSSSPFVVIVSTSCFLSWMLWDLSCGTVSELIKMAFPNIRITFAQTYVSFPAQILYCSIDFFFLKLGGTLKVMSSAPSTLKV